MLKDINPKYSLEGQMLKLKYFGQLMWRTYSLEKALLLGKIEGRRRRGWQKMRWLDDITNLMTWVWAISRNWWRTEKPGVLQSMGLQRVRHDWVTELNLPCVICLGNSVTQYIVSMLKIRIMPFLNNYSNNVVIEVVKGKRIIYK